MGLRELWVFWSIVCVIMMMLSAYEGKRLIKRLNITKPSTKFYILGGLFAVWGMLALIALGYAGVG